MHEISVIGNDDYYVRIASVWYWAEALSICPYSALPYLESREMDPRIRKKAIQKARESRKIPKELKKLLNDMK